MILKTYRAKAAGWIAGRRVAAGEELRLTAAQAKYEPVEEAAPVAKRATATATAKPARKSKAAAKPAAGDVETVPATDPVTTPEPDPV